MNSRKISKESSTARKHAVLLALSLLLFFVCFRFGLILAESKPIWNDEFYSQLANVQGLSYGKMMAGQVNEGNNAPLFYLIQKVICDIASYQAPEAWVKGDWGYSDYYSRILLRVSPVFFMSLAAVFIFYYFSRVYSIFTFSSSYLVWVHWAEARPYSLWFFLTTVQSLVFLHIVQNKDMRPKIWAALIVIHLCLSLTVSLGVAQIFVASSLLWIFVEKNNKR